MVESKVPNWNWFTHRVPDRKSKDISNICPLISSVYRI